MVVISFVLLLLHNMISTLLLQYRTTADIHKLHPHVTRLGLAITARRASDVELSAQMQLAARAADVGNLGIVRDDPVMCVSKVRLHVIFINKTHQS